MDSAWVDVSIPLRTGMVHWPGDKPVVIEQTQSIARGDPANLSVLSMGAHSGTHIDAPRHFLASGKTIDQMPPDVMVGRARVIGIAGAAVEPGDLSKCAIGAGDRVLFKTANSARPWTSGAFSEDYVYISEAAAAYLAEKRVGLVGIDYLSVADFRSTAGTHRLLMEAGVWLVEGLYLADIEPGEYCLVCLPLKIAGAEGAPARALLKRLGKQ